MNNQTGVNLPALAMVAMAVVLVLAFIFGWGVA